MNDQFERRSFATKIEVRKASGKNYLVGRVASYQRLSADLGGFREILAPGAFTRALREKDDAVFTLNHDANALPFGRVSSGRLQLSEDSAGLNCRCDLPNTQAARDLAESISRGDIREMSFAFSVPEGGDSWGQDIDEDGKLFVKRSVHEIKPLFDVSAVLHPAYPSGTNVSLDMLTAENVSSVNLKVSQRALAEARSRGGYAPAPRIVVPAERSKFDLHRRSEEIGKRIAADDYNAGLSDFINNRPRPNSHVQEQ
jgi:Escherichia/Staphylococcus phage prohead protease